VQTLVLTTRNRRRCYLGLLLCALTLVFAASAKTALYRPDQREVRALTSTKICQNNAVPDDAGPTVLSPAPVLFAILLLMFVTSRGVIDLARPEETAIRKNAWFTTSLSVRPPPTI
jgi:hypothetical protein